MFFTDDTLSQLKLIDLGSSDDLSHPEIRETKHKEQAKGRGVQRNAHKYYVGTSQYMAPECFHNQPTGKYSDIWSLGCVLYQLYTGLCPFRGNSDYLIFKLSENAEILRLEKLSTNILP